VGVSCQVSAVSVWGRHFADQARRGYCGGADFEQIVEMRLARRSVGDHQLDETDDYREVVAEDVDVG
jgi:hypothetical protein